MIAIEQQSSLSTVEGFLSLKEFFYPDRVKKFERLMGMVKAKVNGKAKG